MTNKLRRLPDWLQDIREAIRNVRSDLGGLTKLEFENDGKTVRAVSKGIEDIGEAANQIMRIAPALEAMHPQAWQHLTRVYAMRNILSHSYFRTDTGVVWDTVHLQLPQLEALLAEISVD